MTSIIVDDLFKMRQDMGTGVAYIYLDYAREEEQTLRRFIAGIIRQLAYGQAAIEERLKVLYDTCMKETVPDPTLEQLCEVLDFAIGQFGKVFVCVDALDECKPPRCRKELVSKLIDLQSKFGANILLTARANPMILESFQDQAVLLKQIIASSDDIEAYLNHQLPSIYPACVTGSPDLLEEAKRVIIETADGMYA